MIHITRIYKGLSMVLLITSIIFTIMLPAFLIGRETIEAKVLGWVLVVAYVAYFFGFMVEKESKDNQETI